MLQLDSVCLHVGKRIVCRDLSLRLNPGDVLAIVGGNGIGKSTLLRAMAGLQGFGYAGKICLQGNEVSQQKTNVLARARAWSDGLPVSVQSMCVRDVVALALWPELGLFGRLQQVHHERVAQALAAWDLSGLGDHLLAHLSLGQRARVNLARVACQRVDVVLLDEPEANLDPRYQHLPWLYFKQFGQTCVFVTHRLNLAIEHATKWLVLFDGGGYRFGVWGEDVLPHDLDRSYGASLAHLTQNNRVYYI